MGSSSDHRRRHFILIVNSLCRPEGQALSYVSAMLDLSLTNNGKILILLPIEIDLFSTIDEVVPFTVHCM